MADLTALHEELARVVVVGRDLSVVLTEITGIARRAMPGAEATSITLVRGDDAHTAAFDGQLAIDADELQYERGHGPCLDAGRAGQIFVVDDMRTEQRWPDYARHTAAIGVRSSLSVPLPFQDAVIGAVNNYATRPEAFGDTDVEFGQEVASWVALAVGHARLGVQAGQDLAGMRAAMASRAVIEQAKGILMERNGITADEAFTVLTRASQRANTKLRDVARQLVSTGTLPGT
ncbi:transcriptional regulator [Nakamurella endophytica]|uniref:Transcriptional regulator n=2 Tax=Nakamurella endophytica TaxID=1748367 RepID=A0A917T8Z2_9ACTN|nr:transcriptional regulator [Nakamurella endophytica]